MGLFQSRQERGVEDIEISAARSYVYPPKYGNFFSSHFIMGGEKFKTVNPESFLFGENNDLNYLSNKPIMFPYPPPAADEPSRTLRSLVHLRKDTLRLIKVTDDQGVESNDYTIEFTFDADVACAVRIYLFAAENLAGGIARYTSQNRHSEPVFFQRGSNRVYSNNSFQIDPSQFNEEEFKYQPGGSPNEAMAIPVVIQITVEEEEFSSQCEVTLATFERHYDYTYSIKLLKQKIVADGICYIIQEIYGIENKKDGTGNGDDDYDENGVDCVICMCEMRDTLILPCRHLCLCNSCANSLRFQASNCPICRSPFHALLQIKAVRKKTQLAGAATSEQPSQESEEYEEVPLVEALNGYLPTDGASGYASRQSSARRSKSRNGSRSGSRKSKSVSAKNDLQCNCLPPVDKVDQHAIVSRSVSCPDSGKASEDCKSTRGVFKQTSVEVKSRQDYDEPSEAAAVVASSPAEQKEDNDTEHEWSEDLQASLEKIQGISKRPSSSKRKKKKLSKDQLKSCCVVEDGVQKVEHSIVPCTGSESDQKESHDDDDTQSEDLQASLQSQALHEMIFDAPSVDAMQLIEEAPVNHEITPSIDLSLPGTPLGSDFSSQSVSSVDTQKTASTTAGSSSSVYSTRGQVSTPYVNIEDN